MGFADPLVKHDANRQTYLLLLGLSRVLSFLQLLLHLCQGSIMTLIGSHGSRLEGVHFPIQPQLSAFSFLETLCQLHLVPVDLFHLIPKHEDYSLRTLSVTFAHSFWQKAMTHSEEPA